ncbi:hypothetical protein AAV34_06975 [Bacillus velezensis]|nr:hypothetical protein AAV34_06975 [Bacillus velezensis]KRQ91115.1 hypothetical protein AOA15_03435 [Bacillus velezensis]KRT32937.1 hypothetical protein PV82_03445 [Bacillus velezensis]KTF55353.1 hypothetical protein ATE50_07435 [Bacillus velezensis]
MIEPETKQLPVIIATQMKNVGSAPITININIKDKMKTITTIIHTFLKMKYPNIPNRKEAAGRKIRMIYAGLNSGLIQTPPNLFKNEEVPAFCLI